MKTRIHLLFIAVAFVLGSCSPSLLDEIIDPATLFDMAAKIRKEMPTLEPAKMDVLSRLETINKGYDAYASTTPGKVVETEKFDMYKEQLFNYFFSRGATYRQLFDEVEVMNAFDKKYGEKFQELYQQIDVFCVAKQTEIDKKESQVQRTIAELSKSIDVNIISISKTRYFQHEAVEVLAQIKNTTKAPIEAIDFNLYVSKGGTVIAKLPIRLDERFVSNKMKKFSYSKESHSAIFNALKNIDIYSITLKEEVFRMNHDGKIIDAYAPIRGVKNHQYKPTGILTGTCPYLSPDDVLQIELEQMQKMKKQELTEATPCLAKIEYIREMLQAES